MEKTKLPKFICDEFVTTFGAQNIAICSSHGRFDPFPTGAPTEATTFQPCSQGHGAIQLHHWLQFLFHLESSDFSPESVAQKYGNLARVFLYIYIYMFFQLVNVYIYTSCTVYVCVEIKTCI